MEFQETKWTHVAQGMDSGRGLANTLMKSMVSHKGGNLLTLRLLMSYIYIYIYIYMELLVKPEMLTSYIYMDLRLATLKQSLSICCTMFQH